MIYTVDERRMRVLSAGDLSISILPPVEWDVWIDKLDDDEMFFFKGPQYSKDFDDQAQFTEHAERALEIYRENRLKRRRLEN